MSAEIAKGLPAEDQPPRRHKGGGEAACLADLTAGEVGGLGGLDYDEEEEAAQPRRPQVVGQEIDLACQVKICAFCLVSGCVETVCMRDII